MEHLSSLGEVHVFRFSLICVLQWFCFVLRFQFEYGLVLWISVVFCNYNNDYDYSYTMLNLPFIYFWTAFVIDTVDYGDWFDYVHEWEKVTNENPEVPIHIVHYEDVKSVSMFYFIRKVLIYVVKYPNKIKGIMTSRTRVNLYPYQDNLYQTRDNSHPSNYLFVYL